MRGERRAGAVRPRGEGRGMNCRQVQDWLLEAEDPRPQSSGPAEIAGHLHDCSVCRRFAEQLADLERTWRSLPVPREVERAKAAFLDRLGAPAVPLRLPERAVSRRHVLRWCAASAASLLAAGAGGWLLLSQREARAADDLLDRLVDWNLRLTHAASETERGQLYAEQAAQFRQALGVTNLPPEQAQLAADFLDNGAWLVSQQDPVVEADRFDGLADRLLQLARAAGTSGNQRRMQHLLKQYNRVLEAGIEVNVERAEAAGTLDFEHQRKLERLALGDAQRIQQLASLVSIAPDASRKEIQRALGLHRKHAKKYRENRPGHAGKARRGHDADEERSELVRPQDNSDC